MRQGEGSDADVLFARLVVEQGLARPEQVEECLSAIARLSEQGVTPLPRLGDMLVRKGYLTPAAHEATLRRSQAGTPSRTPAPVEDPPEVALALHVPARVVGKYVRVERIGVGGMGEVWRAWDRELRRWVALKFLRGNDPEELARFEREAQTAAKLSHPNIAAVYDVGEHEGRPYIAMQLVHGKTLHTFPRDDRRLLVELLRDAAHAIQYAHEEGVIHRDLKPANLMVEGERRVRPKTARRERGSTASAGLRVYVMDFGLAKQTAIDSSVSVSGSVLGTPAYMAPEQARGRLDLVGPRSDVYSLGATLYELLSGQPAFRETNAYDQLRQVIEEDPKPLRRVKPDVDPDLDVIVMKCLEKDPAQRYASALALAEDLERHLEGEPIVGRPAGLAYRLRKRLRKNVPLTVAVAAAVAIALGAGGILAAGAWRRAKERDAELRAVHERAGRLREEALGEVGRKNWAEALVKLGQYLAIRPDDAEALDRKRECERILEEQKREAASKGTALEAAELCRRAQEQVKEAKALWRIRTSRRDQWERLLAQALQLARSALERYPDLASAHHTLGEVQEARGLWEEAAERYERAIRLDPNLAESYHRAALCYLQIINQDRARRSRGDIPLAEEDQVRKERALDYLRRYTRLRNLGENETQPQQYAEAAVAFAEGRYPEAERLCDELLKRDQTDEWVWLFKAVSQANRGSPEASLRTFDTLLTSVIPQFLFGYSARAQVRAQTGDLKGAVADYDRAIEIKPDSPVLYYLRGATRGSLGDWKGDVDDCTEAIRLDPRYAPAYSNRAVSRGNLGDHAGAIEDATRAIELHPNFGPAYNVRANARARLKDLAGALEDNARAVEHMPNFALVHLNRAKLLRDKEDFKATAESASRAIELDPRNSEAWSTRADARVRLGDYKGAVADCSRMIELDPNNRFGYANRAWAHEKLGDRRRALEDYDRAVELGYRTASLLEARGMLRWRGDDVKGARDDFARAVEIDPNYASGLLNLGIAENALGRSAEALAALDRYLEKRPREAVALAKRARVRWNLRDYAGAVTDATRAIELEPKSSDAYAVRGAARWHLKDYRGAKDDLDRAIALDASNSWAWFNRAEARRGLGDWAGVVDDCTRHLALQPASAYSLELRAEAHARLGNLPAALEDASAWVQAQPRSAAAWAQRGRLRLSARQHAAALEDFKKALELDPGRKAEWAPLVEECERALR